MNPTPSVFALGLLALVGASAAAAPPTAPSTAACKALQPIPSCGRGDVPRCLMDIDRWAPHAATTAYCAAVGLCAAAREGSADRGGALGCALAVELLLKGGKLHPDPSLAATLAGKGCATGSAPIACEQAARVLVGAYHPHPPVDLTRGLALAAEGCERGETAMCAIPLEMALGGSLPVGLDAVWGSLRATCAQDPAGLSCALGLTQRATDEAEAACNDGDGAACHRVGAMLLGVRPFREDERAADSLFQEGCALGDWAACWAQARRTPGLAETLWARTAALAERACASRAPTSRARWQVGPGHAAYPGLGQLQPLDPCVIALGAAHQARDEVAMNPSQDRSLARSCDDGDEVACEVHAQIAAHLPIAQADAVARALRAVADKWLRSRDEAVFRRGQRAAELAPLLYEVMNYAAVCEAGADATCLDLWQQQRWRLGLSQRALRALHGACQRGLQAACEAAKR